MDTLKVNQIEVINAPRQDLGGLAIGALTLGIAGIIVAVVQKVVQDTGATMTAGSAAKNATDNVLIGGVNLSSNFSIIGTVLGLSAVVGLLVGAFLMFRGR